MNSRRTNINEMLAGEAFTEQSKIFDQLYSSNKIIQYKRERVREHLKKYIVPGQLILELNSGTGVDAIWLAQQNCKVHATDISSGMQEKLIQKIYSNKVEHLVSYELCSFTELDNLQMNGPFDVIFSNFAGLNCTDRLDKVLASFSSLLKPNGIVTMVIMPKFCLWEFLLIAKGKFKTATRRFFSSKGRKANVEGHLFKCWYYSPGFVKKYLKNTFDVISLEGLCVFVPPSYIEHFAEKHPRLFQFLKSVENKWKSHWPWKYIGDYFIISMRKR
ncbi:MAG: class I SAM-dependent methyltransferase [Ginsengibacter sp.]